MITSNTHCQHCSAPLNHRRANQKFCTKSCKDEATLFARLVATLNKHFVTIKQAAEALGISTSTVRQKIKRGELASYQLRGRLLVRRDQLNSKGAC